MLQVFVFAAYFATVAEAQTALQTFCATLGVRAVYNGTSCYVMHLGVGYRYSIQKNSCQDILGYYGHLAFVRNSVLTSVINSLILVSLLCEPMLMMLKFSAVEVKLSIVSKYCTIYCIVCAYFLNLEPSV